MRHQVRPSRPAAASLGRRLIAGCTGAVLAGAAVVPAGLVLSPAAHAAAASALVPPAVPGTDHAYLGAFVDPSGARPPTPTELDALPAFNQALARNLSIVRIDQPWATPTTDVQLNQVLAEGGIPLIEWRCGAPDRAVANGTDDAAISSFAQQLAAWGAPVFLDWFPDPNVTAARASKTGQCLGGAGPSGYQKAFQHIHNLFVQAGAHNVAFVWSVAAEGGDSNWASYYPGPVFVDWIAGTGNIRATTLGPSAFANYFGSWYSTFSSAGKPLMVDRTATSTAEQSTYLQQVAVALPAKFPLIKAFVYSDTRGTASFELGPAGLPAFVSLSRSGYFQPVRQAASISVSVAPSPVASGQTVQLTASTAVPDQGGTITFYDDGVPLGDCTSIAITFATSCSTDSLPVGHNSVTAVYSGDAEYAGATSSPATVLVNQEARPPAASKKPMVPSAGHAYLGGWINPVPLQDEPAGTTHMQAEIKFLPGFDAQLGRPLSIVHAYQRWTNLTPAYQLRDVLADGAIPMIDWRCGDTDANIVAGHDDALITSFAKELAALQAPIFLRWYYEPNFPGSANYKNCISSGGPAGYAQAFRHIHNLFMAAGATNVAFVWAIAMAGDQTDITSYYPGSTYVDWIGADGYYRAASIAAGQDAFAGKFSAWYSEFSSFGKPMMVSETAAFAGSQAQYLQEVNNDLPKMPAIKAVAYFDAPAKSGTFPFALDPAGIQEFTAVSRNPYFMPTRNSSTVRVTASPVGSAHARKVLLTANVGADLGGTVSFSVDGAPLAGCQSLPISTVVTCRPDVLPPGTDTFTAVYSGDAEFAPASSAPASVSIASGPSPGTKVKTPGDPPPDPAPSAATPLGSGIGGTMSLTPVPSIDVPAVEPVAPLAPLDASAPLVAAPKSAIDPPGPASVAVKKSQDPPGVVQFAAKALPSPFRFNKWVLLGLVIVVGLGGYIGGTWVMDQLARRRARERS